MMRQYAEHMHSPLVMCSAKTNMHMKQVFTIVVGSVFQIKIKSRQRHNEGIEPLLEYDTKQRSKRSVVREAWHTPITNSKCRVIASTTTL